MLSRNVGQINRVVRVLAGAGLLALLFIGPVPGWGLVGLLGFVLLGTAATSSCPIYSVLGVSTCPVEEA